MLCQDYLSKVVVISNFKARFILWANVGIWLVRFIYLILFSSVNFSVYGAKPVVTQKRFDTRDGLPSDLVYGIEQDNLGYVWFGTSHGLSRFDGHEFVNASISNGAPDSDILNFYKDSKGQIWCYTMNGNLAVIYDGGVHKYTIDQYPLSRVNEQIYDIVEFNDRIYISTKNSVWSFKEGKLTYCSEVNRGGRLVSDGNDLWLLSSTQNHRNDLFKLSEEKDYWEWQYETAFIVGGSSYCIKNGDNFYSYYLSANCSISVLNVHDHTVSNFVAPSRVYNLGQTDTGLICYTESGIYEWNFESKDFSRIISGFPATNSFVDCFENAWMSSYGKGVILQKPQNNVTAVLKRNGGYSKLIESRNRFFLINNQRDSLWELSRRGEVSLRHVGPRIRDCYSLYSGRLLFSSELHPENTMFGIYTFDIQSYKNKLYAVSSDLILIFREFADSVALEQKIADRRFGFVKQIFPIHDSSFYFMNRLGLFEYTIQDSAVVTKFDQVVPNSVCVIGDTLYVGTNGAGLWVVHGKDTVKANTANSLLTSDYVKKVVVKSSEVWVLTEGMLEVLIHNNTGLTYSHRVVGVPGEYEDFLVFQDSVLIVSDEGLFVIRNPEMDQTVDVMLHIDRMGTENGLMKEQSKIVVRPDERMFELDFSTIFFHTDLNVSYRYRMAAYNNSETPQSWVYTDKSELAMANLNADSYVLEIQYKHENIPWTMGIMLGVEVQPSWWETIWFRVVVLIVASIALTVISFRINRFLKNKKRQQIARLQAELRSRKAQMNPHFVSNALNSVRNFILLNDIKSSDQYLTDYAKLMRMTLGFSDRLMVLLSDELEYVSLYLKIEQLRLSNSFTYNVVIDESLDISQLKCPTMILQPFVENAVWHGVAPATGHTKILLEIKDKVDVIEVLISDTGVGFDLSEHKQASSGMFIVEEKLKLLRQTYHFDIKVEISSEIDNGTVVNLRLPKIKKRLND